MRWFPKREVKYDNGTVARSLLVGLALSVSAAVGLAYVTGFASIASRLAHASWWWLVPAFAAVLVAFAGYYFAYRGVRRAEDGPDLGRRAMLAVVTAGFGGFLSQGGGALDEYAMQAGGASEREARVRVLALGGFEQGALAVIVCPTAAVALLLGLAVPRPGFTWPWAVIPLPAFLLASWLAVRYRHRLVRRSGWRRHLSLALDALHLVVFGIFLRPRQRGWALIGMLLYWGGDMLALWATTAAFGYEMSAPAVIVGLGSGMIITRRTAPLGGAGIISLVLVPTLWYGSGVPLAASVLGIVFYRLFTMWVPILPGLIALPALRSVGRHARTRPREGARVSRRRPVLSH